MHAPGQYFEHGLAAGEFERLLAAHLVDAHVGGRRNKVCTEASDQGASAAHDGQQGVHLFGRFRTLSVTTWLMLYAPSRRTDESTISY